MLILGLDTSSAISAALVEMGEFDGVPNIIASRSHHDPRRHAELLAPTIEQLLAETGTARTSLDALAVGTGPGPFTGLRVGIVTARALGLALQRPVYGICSLDALARDGFASSGKTQPVDELLATSDARRRELYWARYRRDTTDNGTWTGDVIRIGEPQVGPAQDIPSDGPIVGRGPGLYPEALTGSPLVEAPQDPDAAAIASLAILRVLGRRVAPFDCDGELLATSPRYLRRPDVAAPGQRKRAS